MSLTPLFHHQKWCSLFSGSEADHGSSYSKAMCVLSVCFAHAETWPDFSFLLVEKITCPDGGEVSAMHGSPLESTDRKKDEPGASVTVM